MIGYEAYTNETSPSIIQFENANEGRSYPFDDNTTLVDLTGETLPDSFISDMHLVIPTGYDAYLTSAYVSSEMLSACIKIVKASAIQSALSVTVKRDEFSPYMPYRFEKLTGGEDIGGVITFGNVDFSSGTHVYRFGGNSARIADSAVARYVPARLRSIIDDRTGERVRGDVKITFSNYIEPKETKDGIRLDLEDGANEILLPECERDRPVNSCGATPVATINGIRPDDRNRIVIWFH